MASPFSAVGPRGRSLRTVAGGYRSELMGAAGDEFVDPSLGFSGNLRNAMANIAPWGAGIRPQVDRPFAPINVEGMPAVIRQKYEQMVRQDPRAAKWLAMENPELYADLTPEEFDRFLLEGQFEPWQGVMSEGQQFVRVPSTGEAEMKYATPVRMGPETGLYHPATGKEIIPRGTKTTPHKLQEAVTPEGKRVYVAWDPNDPLTIKQVQTDLTPAERQPAFVVRTGAEEQEARGGTEATLRLVADYFDLVDRTPPGVHGLRGGVTRTSAALAEQFGGANVGALVRSFLAGGPVTATDMATLQAYQRMILTHNREILTGDKSRLSDQDIRIAQETLGMDWWTTEETAKQAMMTVAMLRIRHDEEVRKESDDKEPMFPVDTLADQKKTVQRFMDAGFNERLAVGMLRVLLGDINVADIVRQPEARPAVAGGAP